MSGALHSQNRLEGLVQALVVGVGARVGEIGTRALLGHSCAVVEGGEKAVVAVRLAARDCDELVALNERIDLAVCATYQHIRVCRLDAHLNGNAIGLDLIYTRRAQFQYFTCICD